MNTNTIHVLAETVQHTGMAACKSPPEGGRVERGGVDFEADEVRLRTENIIDTTRHGLMESKI